MQPRGSIYIINGCVLTDILYLYILDSRESKHVALEQYESKSLNNRNFIITLLQEYLQKLFLPYFSTQSPCFTTRLVHQSTSLQMPSRKKSFLAWPLTNFAPPPLPRCHLQNSGPADVLSQVQTNESPMTPGPDCMVGVSIPQISEHLEYPLYAQPYGGGRCLEVTVLLLREVPGVSIVSRASTRSLACHCIEHQSQFDHFPGSAPIQGH